MKRQIIKIGLTLAIVIGVITAYAYIRIRSEIAETEKRRQNEKIEERLEKEKKKQKKIDGDISWNLKELNLSKEEENRIKTAIRKWNDDGEFYDIEYVDVYQYRDEKNTPSSFKVRIKYMTTYVIASVDVGIEIRVSLFRTASELQAEVPEETDTTAPDGTEE